MFIILLAACTDKAGLHVEMNDTIVSEAPNHVAGQYIVRLSENAVKIVPLRQDNENINSEEDRLNQLDRVNQRQNQNLFNAREYMRQTFEVPADNIVSAWHGKAPDGAGAAVIALKNITVSKIAAIRKHRDVVAVDLNETIDAFGQIKQIQPGLQYVKHAGIQSNDQQLNCAVEAVGGLRPNISTNPSKVLWIIDVGIDYDNPDISLSTLLDKCTLANCVDENNGEVSCPGTAGVENLDPNASHGSIIAEIAGAYNNSIGGVGVAPGARIASVKAANCNGQYTTQSLIAALVYISGIVANKDVVNLSAGVTSPNECSNPISSDFFSTLTDISDQGAYVAVGAGNSGIDAEIVRPACFNIPNVFTVTSATCSGTWAGKNYGVDVVDYAAPSPQSFYGFGATYADIQGAFEHNGLDQATSFATPIVAGILYANNGRIYDNFGVRRGNINECYAFPSRDYIRTFQPCTYIPPRPDNQPDPEPDGGYNKNHET